MADTIPLSDLSLAVYCPRKLYYARGTDRSPPQEYADALHVSRRYGEVFGPQGNPPPADRLAVHPRTFQDALRSAKEGLAVWSALIDPDRTDVLLAGKDVHGRVAKVLDEPLAPTVVSPGAPPPEGVWQPQAVKAVGAAKALAWEEGASIDRAYVEYPRHGIIRSVSLSTRQKAAYRRTLHAIRSMNGPPPRIGDDSKCDTCRFGDQCGVRTRSLRSLLPG